MGQSLSFNRKLLLINRTIRLSTVPYWNGAGVILDNTFYAILCRGSHRTWAKTGIRVSLSQTPVTVTSCGKDVGTALGAAAWITARTETFRNVRSACIDQRTALVTNHSYLPQICVRAETRML